MYPQCSGKKSKPIKKQEWIRPDGLLSQFQSKALNAVMHFLRNKYLYVRCASDADEICNNVNVVDNNSFNFYHLVHFG
jgi:hypothetical protein